MRHRTSRSNMGATTAVQDTCTGAAQIAAASEESIVNVSSDCALSQSRPGDDKALCLLTTEYTVLAGLFMLALYITRPPEKKREGLAQFLGNISQQNITALESLSGV